MGEGPGVRSGFGEGFLPFMRHAPLINIARRPFFARPLQKKLANHPIFHKRNPRLVTRRIHHQNVGHTFLSPCQKTKIARNLRDLHHDSTQKFRVLSAGRRLSALWADTPCARRYLPTGKYAPPPPFFTKSPPPRKLYP